MLSFVLGGVVRRQLANRWISKCFRSCWAVLFGDWRKRIARSCCEGGLLNDEVWQERVVLVLKSESLYLRRNV